MPTTYYGWTETNTPAQKDLGAKTARNPNPALVIPTVGQINPRLIHSLIIVFVTLALIFTQRGG